jgi:hypothetical protein
MKQPFAVAELSLRFECHGTWERWRSNPPPRAITPPMDAALPQRSFIKRTELDFLFFAGFWFCVFAFLFATSLFAFLFEAEETFRRDVASD